ncbi:hypothetical protein HPP92_006830 [Vanilla planifolia]|uniref:Uncharacterized protein n=1 Tax=Vanilla planifolia TaxID=51239 RepID=A0A835V922_VANPL|nr:hypothetical protein HPP92_006830 [Vanilla planifolia]
MSGDTPQRKEHVLPGWDTIAQVPKHCLSTNNIPQGQPSLLENDMTETCDFRAHANRGACTKPKEKRAKVQTGNKQQDVISTRSARQRAAALAHDPGGCIGRGVASSAMPPAGPGTRSRMRAMRMPADAAPGACSRPPGPVLVAKPGAVHMPAAQSARQQRPAPSEAWCTWPGTRV